MFLGWVWLSGKVSIWVTGKWGHRYHDGNGDDGDRVGFSQFGVYGLMMAAGRACGWVYAWSGSVRQTIIGWRRWAAGRR